jgi:hypothetical protein
MTIMCGTGDREINELSSNQLGEIYQERREKLLHGKYGEWLSGTIV